MQEAKGNVVEAKEGATPEIQPGELQVKGVTKSYGASQMRKEVVRDC